MEQPSLSTAFDLEHAGHQLVYQTEVQQAIFRHLSSPKKTVNVYLFDCALVLIDEKKDKPELKPIPLELLSVSFRADQGSDKDGYPLCLTHLARDGYMANASAKSAKIRQELVDHIRATQEQLDSSKAVFKVHLKPSCESFTENNRVDCMALFPEEDSRAIYGTQSGIFLGEGTQEPVRILAIPNVSHLAILPDRHTIVARTDDLVNTYLLSSLTAVTPDTGLTSVAKLTSKSTFFTIGSCNGQILLCVVKSNPLSSTFKVFAIVAPISGTEGKTNLELYKEFYLPKEATAVQFLKTKLLATCTSGAFEVIDLETLDTQALVDPADASLKSLTNNVGPPISMFRVDQVFLLCFRDVAFFCDRNGWRARIDFEIRFRGRPAAFAVRYPYLLGFEPNFVEIWSLEAKSLVQVIRGNSVRLLSDKGNIHEDATSGLDQRKNVIACVDNHIVTLEC